jgi:hypothetical protein
MDLGSKRSTSPVRTASGRHYHLTLHTAILLALIAALQTVPAPAPQTAGLVEDAGRLAAASTNEARFDVLTTMLRGRGLTFEIELSRSRSRSAVSLARNGGTSS